MRRLLLILTLAGLAAGAIGSPVAAGGTIRMVDDDGRAAAANCGGGAAAAKKIQSAIDASGPGDTVVVCPGTYLEQPVIRAAKDGLVLRAAVTRKAIIRAPKTLVRDAIVSIRDGAQDVTVQGFVLRYHVDRDVVAGILGCGLFAGVRVDGPDALVTTNTIRADGEGTTSQCGIEYGVAVGEDGPGSADVRFNIVRDFTEAGIAAGGAATRLDAVRNIIRFHHADSALLGASARRVVTRRPSTPRQTTWARQASGPAGQFPLESDGITVFDGADATIVENIIEGSQPGRGPLADEDRLHLAYGIELLGAGDVAIRRNRVYRAYTNIVISHGIGTAGPAPSVKVRANVVLSGIYGIILSSDGATYRDNQVSANVFGLFALAFTSDNVLRDNDARYNLDTDCTDLTSDSAATVANTWTDNLGFSSEPDDLCGSNQ